MLEIFMAKGRVIASVVGLLSLILTWIGLLPNYTPIVTTESGLIQGRQSFSRNGRIYYEYLGIPFAEPPVGKLRFEAPVPFLGNWSDVRSATSYSPYCLQIDAMVTGRLMGVEDCLYLDVMTGDTTPEKLKPVIVWIYGGGFLSGATSMYRPLFMMDEDIVLVTINYRVGPLGFLNSGDDGVIRGNMGLKDQSLALKWVQRNIANFGGDPRRVTLMGESAGAVSVQLHMLSPASAGLFQRAIALSGSVFCPWAFNANPGKIFNHYTRILNCPRKNAQDMKRCLKKADMIEMINLQMNLTIPTNDFLAFLPSIEVIKDHHDHYDPNAFLTEDPRKLWREGRLSNNVPLLIGVNSGEGALRTARFDAMPELIPVLDTEWESIAPRFLSLEPFRNQEKIMGKVRRYYFGDGFTEDLQSFRRNFTKLNSDSTFFRPVRTSAVIHASSHGVDTYMYYYDYNSLVFPSVYSWFRAIRPEDWIVSELSLVWTSVVDWVKENILGVAGPHEFGATHADDLLQLWNIRGITALFSWPDARFSRNFVKALVDFARNEESLKFDGVRWSSISVTNSALPPKYMKLGNDKAQMIIEPFSERMSFWDSLNLVDLSY